MIDAERWNGCCDFCQSRSYPIWLAPLWEKQQWMLNGLEKWTQAHSESLAEDWPSTIAYADAGTEAE